jgi:hypothetical protein
LEAHEPNYEHQELRDGLMIRDWTTTYIDTPDEMAENEYVRPMRRSWIGKDWPQ